MNDKDLGTSNGQALPSNEYEIIKRSSLRCEKCILFLLIGLQILIFGVWIKLALSEVNDDSYAHIVFLLFSLFMLYLIMTFAKSIYCTKARREKLALYVAKEKFLRDIKENAEIAKHNKEKERLERKITEQEQVISQCKQKQRILCELKQLEEIITENKETEDFLRKIKEMEELILKCKEDEMILNSIEKLGSEIIKHMESEKRKTDIV